MSHRFLQLLLIVLLALAPFQIMPSLLADADPLIQALTPEHVGLTSQPQPTLYWYLSAITPRPLVFILTVIDGESTQTILAEPLAPPARAGVQRIRLKDYGITLRERYTYQWSVALDVPPDATSTAVETSATMEFVNCKDLRASDGCSEFWYDLLEAISEAIEKEPGNRTLRDQRTMLLKQGGLGRLVEQYKDLAE